MKIAYLLLIHQRPRHFARMLRALDDDGVHFFVHIDAKSDISPFRKAAAEYTNVTFLESPERVLVFWSGFSTITAILNLLRAAHRTHPSFVRYALLSGADFPIKPNDQIREALRSDIEFIRADHRIDPQIDDRHSRRIRYLHLYDRPLFNPKTSRHPRFATLSGRLLRLLPQRSLPSIPLYQGSAWWALTAPCVEFILRYVEDNPAYSNFFRYVSTPDEVFFHSIVFHSPFRPKVSHDVESVSDPFHDRFDGDDHASHFIDWKTPGIELPKILDLSDMDRIRKSKALFARKFRSPRSDSLIREIQARLVPGNRTVGKTQPSPTTSLPGRMTATGTSRMSEALPRLAAGASAGWKQEYAEFYYRNGRGGRAYELRSRLSTAPSLVAFRPDHCRSPVYLRTHTTDLSAYQEVIRDGAYALAPVRSPRIILDCGANIGLTSVFFANRYPEAKIIALEPDPSNFELCVMNCAPYENITPSRTAVWSHKSTVSVFDPGGTHGEWGIRVGAQPDAAAERILGRAPAFSIDEIMRQHQIDRIDLLKVDIEGAELEVFSNPSAWLDRVGVVIVETHERFRPGSRAAVRSALSKFEDQWEAGQNEIFARSGWLTPE